MLNIFNTEEGSQRGTEQNIHRQTERKIVYINLKKVLLYEENRGKISQYFGCV